MGEHKLQNSKASRQQKDVSEDLAVISEVGAYQAWQEVMDIAYRKDGFIGAIQAAVQIITQVDAIANLAEEEAPNCPNLHRATVSTWMQMEYLPAMAELLKSLPDGHY